ncbi:MAG: hypothetical protein LBI62_04505 [Candidatus Accumulibacter sp.]|nr:hypothetical protein [Accumulibacter sp.]
MRSTWVANIDRYETSVLIRDQGSGIRDQGSGIRDQGSGIRDQGSERVTGGFAAAEMLGGAWFCLLPRREAPMNF